MAENDKNAIRTIPKHDVKVKASIQERSLVRDIGKGAMEEVIIPKSKEVMRDMSTDIINMVADALRHMVEGIIYPDGNVPNRRSGRNSNTYSGSTNYTSYSRPIGTYQSQGTKTNYRDTLGQRPGNEVRCVWVPTEEKAKEIVNTLKEDIENYGKAKVATFYEMLEDENGNKMPTTFADFKYGWTDVNSVGYYYDTSRRGNENKWFIDLAKPVDITN